MEGYDKGTGPNDARRVVWARFPRRSLPVDDPYLYNKHSIYKCSLVKKINMNNEKKRTHRVPKRHVRCRLGPFSSFTAFPSRFVCPGVGGGDVVVVFAVVVVVVVVVVWCVCFGGESRVVAL